MAACFPHRSYGGPTDSYVANDSLRLAMQSENGLPSDYYGYLVTGGTGLTGKTPDKRITKVNAIPAGPFQLTNGVAFTYNSYAASPVHRFYQMWQQLDCSTANATPDNPSGCDAKLFPWVETTVGAGTNGLAQPSEFQHRLLEGLQQPPVRVPPPWASTTSRTATLLTSTTWRMNMQ